MKVAVVSDELYPVNEFVIQQVKGLGHEVILFGWFNTAMNEESRRAIAALQTLEQERE